MISGHYPFLGDTLQETYDKVERHFLVFNMNVNTRNSLSHCYQIDCQWSCANTWRHESPTCWFDPKASLQRFIFFFKTHMILICWSFGTRCALLTDTLFCFVAWLLYRSRGSYHLAVCGGASLGCWGQGPNSWIHLQVWLWPQREEWFWGITTITRHHQMV